MHYYNGPMIREPDALTARRWDLLVVGGGIHGLFAAYDAARRGLSVALVEADDVGSGLSFNHQRTLHGGLRALQTGDLRRTRQQIRERRMWARVAPWLIRPLPFLLGTYHGAKRSRLAIRAGFKAYEWLSRSRDDHVAVELHLPKTRLESAAVTKRLFPGIPQAGLSGGAVWYDYQTRHPDRLTWLVAVAAERAGATLASYTRALGPLRSGSRISGLRVRDMLDGRERDVEAAVTLLAPGRGLGSLLRACGAGDGPPLLRAMNLLLDRPAKDIALAAPGRSGRMLTAVPWAGAVLVGTGQSDSTVAEDETAPPVSCIDALLDDLNAAFPALHAQRSDVRLVHYGLTPARVQRGRVDLLDVPEIARHGRRGVAGLVSLVGVKYTTARWAAEHAVDAAVAELGGHRTSSPCRTADLVLPYANIADVEGRLVETQRALNLMLDPDIVEHLAAWYGTEAPGVLQYAAEHGLSARLGPSTPVLAGEVAYAVATSAAVRLTDAVLRRTPLGAAGRPSAAAVARAAAIMAERLGWTAERVVGEIALVDARYGIPPTAP